MKYLKYFDEASAYEAYKNGSDYVLPNVSYIEETKGVSYEPYTSPEPIMLTDGNYYLDLFNKLQQIAEKYVNKYNVADGCIAWYDSLPMAIVIHNENGDQIDIDIERSELEIFKCITFANYPVSVINVYTRFSNEPEVHLQNTIFRTGTLDSNGQFTLIPIIN